MALNPGVMQVADAADLVDLSIQDKFVKEEGAKYVTFYRDFCNVRTGNMDETVKDTSISGLTGFQRKAEGAGRPKDKPIQGYDKSVTMTEYSIQFEVTKRMWMFGLKKNNIEGRVSSAKKAAMVRREKDFELRLVNGTSTTYTSEEGDIITISGGDGVALFSSAHTREDGGTNNNNVIYDGTNYNMDFDYDALKALRKTSVAVKGLRGEEMGFDPKYLAFKAGSVAYMDALEVNRPISENKRPRSADNDGSGVKGAYTIFDLHYLTSETAWFAFDPEYRNADYGFQYVESQDITLGNQIVNEDTGNFKYNIDAIYEYYHNDYRPWYGSTGLNA